MALCIPALSPMDLPEWSPFSWSGMNFAPDLSAKKVVVVQPLLFAMIFWLCWYGHIQRPFRFLLGFARLLPAVAQTHPYGFRHGLGADS